MEFIYERNVYDLSAYRKTSSIAAVSKRRAMVQIEGCKVWSLI
jgi:hypothetical protein